MQNVKSVPIMIYTKDGCGFCARAKDLMNTEKIRYEECNVDRIREKDPDKYKPRVNGLVYMTHQTTMPQVSI
ncbi:unnamed protein product [Strongylus vulgaris]|uniref:Glutaredoxin domain-containing protein n=1 Tax=Strongylus vulgaris TaxID=40348 RepID=A0A3P7I2L7_STRVU|nr:unnamed protein product [Strongylus vulgaris]